MNEPKEDYYVGFRVETHHKILKILNNKAVTKYNRGHKNFQIKDICFNGKVVLKKVDSIIVANKHYDEENKTTLSNFLLIVKQKYTKEEALRLVKIINIMGNDRIVKEYSKEFIYGDSILKYFPDIQKYKDAFLSCEQIVPGLIARSWYYAPEIFIKGV